MVCSTCSGRCVGLRSLRVGRSSEQQETDGIAGAGLARFVPSSGIFRRYLSNGRIYRLIFTSPSAEGISRFPYNKYLNIFLIPCALIFNIFLNNIYHDFSIPQMYKKSTIVFVNFETLVRK